MPLSATGSSAVSGQAFSYASASASSSGKSLIWAKGPKKDMPDPSSSFLPTVLPAISNGHTAVGAGDTLTAKEMEARAVSFSPPPALQTPVRVAPDASLQSGLASLHTPASPVSPFGP